MAKSMCKVGALGVSVSLYSVIMGLVLFRAWLRIDSLSAFLDEGRQIIQLVDHAKLDSEKCKTTNFTCGYHGNEAKPKHYEYQVVSATAKPVCVALA